MWGKEPTSLYLLNAHQVVLARELLNIMNNLNGYIAVVLDENSVNSLKEAIPPIHQKLFYHHMTIAYMPDELVYKKYEDSIGKQVELSVTGFCFDDKCQVAIVETNLSEKEVPHVTLSCEENTKPVYSDTLLRNKTNYKVINLKITGEVEVMYF